MRSGLVRVSGALQLLAPGVARVELVPEPDVALAVDPAQVHLAAVADRGEVEQAAVEVAQHDPAPLERRGALAQRDEGLADVLAERPSAVAARALLQRVTDLGVGESFARATHRGEPLGGPGEERARLLEGVVAIVAHASGPRPTEASRARAARPRSPRVRRRRMCARRA